MRKKVTESAEVSLTGTASNKSTVRERKEGDRGKVAAETKP